MSEVIELPEHPGGQVYIILNDGTIVSADVVLTTDGLGNLIPISSGGGGSTTIKGYSANALVRHDYTSVAVTTSAYVQLIASTLDTINYLNIFDSSGQTLVLAVGAAASEVDQIYITPGGTGSINLLIPTGSRVSVKAVSATANVGELDITFLK